MSILLATGWALMRCPLHFALSNRTRMRDMIGDMLAPNTSSKGIFSFTRLESPMVLGRTWHLYFVAYRTVILSRDLVYAMLKIVRAIDVVARCSLYIVANKNRMTASPYMFCSFRLYFLYNSDISGITIYTPN